MEKQKQIKERKYIFKKDFDKKNVELKAPHK